ncbi:MAG: type I secretion system permease/ATPase, partial [Brachymonas sp.]|nr:type I secretion system permease/ATPase [Brachymonas sp.]
INVLALIGSLYVMNVYDRVVPNRAMETLWALSIGVVLANVFEFIARTVRARLTDIAGKKADLVISAALFRRVMALDLAQKPASAGSYANNLRDFESVREFMTSMSLLALVDLPFVLLFIFVIAMVAGPLAWVPLVTIPIVVIVGLLVQKPLAYYINQSMREGSQRQGLAVEAIEGLETLKTNNATSWAQSRWERFTAVTAASGMKVKDLTNLVINFSQLAQQLNTVGVIVWGTYLIHSPNPESRITMGGMIATVILCGRALAPLSQVAGLMMRIQQTRTALQGIDAVVVRKIDRDLGRQYISLQQVKGEMGFENVTFRYFEKGNPAIRNLRFQIKPGEKVGILGRIGSGKSTMLRLAAGLYEPSDGYVTLDGMDVRQIDPSDVRAHVTLFSQQPRLFLGTLRENLQLGRVDSNADDEVLMAALKRFGLDELVRQHPLGLNLPIGEDGHGLSGGQKQLMCLARLALRDPQVVLLDEPTSGLDNMTEQFALQAVAKWAEDKTLLVVTHRPQVLSIVSRIIVIEQGQLLMDGPRDAVLQRLSAPGNTAPSPGPIAPQPGQPAGARQPAGRQRRQQPNVQITRVVQEQPPQATSQPGGQEPQA